MSINVQHDAAICRLLFSVTLLGMFRVSCTHHQEYQKLYLRPLVHVIVLVPLPADSVALKKGLKLSTVLYSPKNLNVFYSLFR